MPRRSLRLKTNPSPDDSSPVPSSGERLDAQASNRTQEPSQDTLDVHPSPAEHPIPVTSSPLINADKTKEAGPTPTHTTSIKTTAKPPSNDSAPTKLPPAAPATAIVQPAPTPKAAGPAVPVRMASATLTATAVTTEMSPVSNPAASKNMPSATPAVATAQSTAQTPPAKPTGKSPSINRQNLHATAVTTATSPASTPAASKNMPSATPAVATAQSTAQTPPAKPTGKSPSINRQTLAATADTTAMSPASTLSTSVKISSTTPAATAGTNSKYTAHTPPAKPTPKSPPTNTAIEIPSAAYPLSKHQRPPRAPAAKTPRAATTNTPSAPRAPAAKSPRIGVFKPPSRAPPPKSAKEPATRPATTPSTPSSAELPSAITPSNSTTPPPTSRPSPTHPVSTAASRAPPVSTGATASTLPIQQYDDEVREVPVEETAHNFPIPDTPPFSISDYDFVSGYASLSQIVLPDVASREVDHDHVNVLKNLFTTKSFNPVIGALVVVQNRDGINSAKFDKDKMLIGSCCLIDGRHRFNAIRELYEADKDKWSHLWKRAPIACVQHKDGFFVNNMERLALSAYFNALSSAVLKVSFLDHVYAAIQTVKVLAQMKSTYPFALSTGEIAKELKDRRTLGDIDERQLRRYATVAQKLAQKDDFYKTIRAFCKSCPGVGLVHLNSPELLSISDLTLWQLALASLRALVINGIRGSFEMMHVRFYDCIRQMFEVIRVVSSYRKIPLDALMDSELSITAHNSKTVFEYIADTMSRYALVENQDAADKTRVRNLKKKLVHLLGEDIEPIEPPEAPAEAAAHAGTVKQAAGEPQPGVVKQGVAGETPGPRRSTRKRKATAQDSDEESFEEVETPRPAKKRKAKGKKPQQQGVSLSENTVSNFLKAMTPPDLSRLMGSLGVKVVAQQEASRLKMRVRARENMALEAAMPMEVLPAFYDSFDDSLPDTLPDAWADPSPYTGPANPSWVRFLTKLPSKWPKDNPIAHIAPWLEAMHVPHEHRAQSVITNLHILRHNHHAVYYRAAHSYYKQRPVSELPDVSSRFSNVITTHEKLWCSAVVEDEAALEFFGEKKEQLSTEGFCILEGFLNDAQMPENIGSFSFPGFKCTHPFFKSLEDEARDSFPGEQSLTNPPARTTWNIMQNVSSSEDSNAVIQGEGRFRMTNFGILERLERDSDKVWTITGRALVDIRIAQCVAALKLTHKLGSQRIFIPRTGGRWILTSQKCQRQVIHTDFKALSRHDTLSEGKSPGYFTIATGEHEVPIWVCSHSHRLAATSSTSKLRAASAASSAHVIRIPPFSVFVGRGDLYYSGLATADTIGNHRSLYYHTFFIPEGADTPRVLSCNPHFSPSFTVNIDDESEDDSEKIPTFSNSTGSIKQPRAPDGSDDEYHTDEIAEGDHDNGDDDDNDIDFSPYI